MNDKITGTLLLVAAVGILAIYSYALFFAGSSIAILVLQITAFVAVAGILGLVGWIGYSIATTSPPHPPEPEVESGAKINKEDTAPAEPPASAPPQESKKTAEKKLGKREAKPATPTVT